MEASTLNKLIIQQNADLEKEKKLFADRYENNTLNLKPFKNTNSYYKNRKSRIRPESRREINQNLKTAKNIRYFTKNEPIYSSKNKAEYDKSFKPNPLRPRDTYQNTKRKSTNTQDHFNIKRKRSEIPADESLEMPRKMRKMTTTELTRNKRFMSLLQSHIKEAKHELKKESKSESMKTREEIARRISENIQKDRVDYKKELFKRARENARLSILRKEFELKNTEWRLSLVKSKTLISALLKLSEQKSHFILTKANPPIFYLPKNSNESSQMKLEESRKFQQTLFKAEKTKVENSLAPKPVMPPELSMDSVEIKPQKENKVNSKGDNIAEKETDAIKEKSEKSGEIANGGIKEPNNNE